MILPVVTGTWDLTHTIFEVETRTLDGIANFAEGTPVDLVWLRAANILNDTAVFNNAVVVQVEKVGGTRINVPIFSGHDVALCWPLKVGDILRFYTAGMPPNPTGSIVLVLGLAAELEC